MEKMAFSPRLFCGLTWIGFCDTRESATTAAENHCKDGCFFVGKCTFTARPEIVIPSQVQIFAPTAS